MTSSRKHPGVASRATVVVIALPLLYPLSFGPACWLQARLPGSSASTAVDVINRPILLMWASTLNQPLGEAIEWYANLGRPRGVGIGIVQEGTKCSAFPYMLNE
jgi:hypothetical protein